MKPRFLNVSLQDHVFISQSYRASKLGAPASTTEPPDTLRQSNVREENKRLDFNINVLKPPPSPLLHIRPILFRKIRLSLFWILKNSIEIRNSSLQKLSYLRTPVLQNLDKVEQIPKHVKHFMTLREDTLYPKQLI